jgi:Spy/CpxP family protein refolding chaperone
MKKRLIRTAVIAAFVLSFTVAYAQEGGEEPEYQEGPQYQEGVCQRGPQGKGPRGEGGPQGRSPNKEKFFEKIVEELDLTAQQQEALRQQRAEHRDKIKALMENLGSKKMALCTELEKEQIDKEKIDGIVNEIKPLLGQQIELRVEDTLAMKEILTAEQYQKFHKFVKKKKGGHGKRGFGMKGRHQGFGDRGSGNGGFEGGPHGNL